MKLDDCETCKKYYNGTCGLNNKFIYDIETCDYRRKFNSKNKIDICDELVQADIKVKVSIS
jgi:hypothetical protein